MMDDKNKKAKMAALMGLMEKMKEWDKEKLMKKKGMKMEIMAEDKEGMMEGLDKAEDMMEMDMDDMSVEEKKKKLKEMMKK